jgi:hypothetical protein
VFGEGIILGDKDVGAGTAMALSFIVKTGVSMSAEYHDVTSLICGAVIRLGGEVF